MAPTDQALRPDAAAVRKHGADRRLFLRYQRDRDPAALDALVRRFEGLATGLARRYAGRGEPLDDLRQVAALGLLKAIERYEPARGTSFSSFAVPTITGELRRHFRDRVWSVRMPRELQELALRIERTAEQMTTENGRLPTIGELAAELGEPVERVLEGREAIGAFRATSLSTTSGDDDESELADRLGDDDGGYRRAELGTDLERLMAPLTERQRTILRLRFKEDLSQSEIGRRVGLSQMHVSRLLRQALAELQALAEHHEIAA